MLAVMEKVYERDGFIKSTNDLAVYWVQAQKIKLTNLMLTDSEP